MQANTTIIIAIETKLYQLTRFTNSINYTGLKEHIMVLRILVRYFIPIDSDCLFYLRVLLGANMTQPGGHNRQQGLGVSPHLVLLLFQ